MKRNTGLIGISRSTSIESAVGVFDKFDQYNRKLAGQWPAVPVYVSISPSSGSYNEGDTIIFSVTTQNVVNGTVLYWTTNTVGGSVNTGDFTDGLVSGSFAVSNNSGTFTRSLVFDGTSEPGDAFSIDIRTGSTGGPVVLSTGTININNPTFSITPNTTSINEGSSVTFTVNTTNVISQTMYYSIAAVSGSISGSDFTSGTTEGNFFLSNNAGSFTITMSNDTTTEGTEQFLVYLRINSNFGTIVATSSTITINDTSLTPSATLTPSANPIDEGSTMTFTVNTTNFSSGTLYWTLENVSGWESTDQSATSGSFTVSGSVGTFNFTVTADGLTEGTEQFLARVRLNSTSGTIIGTSATISINDTSTGTAEPTDIFYFGNATADNYARATSTFLEYKGYFIGGSSILSPYSSMFAWAAFVTNCPTTATKIEFYDSTFSSTTPVFTNADPTSASGLSNSMRVGTTYNGTDGWSTYLSCVATGEWSGYVSQGGTTGGATNNTTDANFARYIGRNLGGCSCSSGTTVFGLRPHIVNLNWGGYNTTCSASTRYMWLRIYF